MKVEIRTVIDLGTGSLGQLPGSDHIILVAVGFKNLCDFRSLSMGYVHVDPTIPSRVHHGRFAPVPQDIGQMSQPLGMNDFEKHGSSSIFFIMKTMTVCVLQDLAYPNPPRPPCKWGEYGICAGEII
jgi:hypothetical protein